MDRLQVALTASIAAAGEAYNQMAAKYDALAAEVSRIYYFADKETIKEHEYFGPSGLSPQAWPAIAAALPAPESQEDQP